MKVSDVIDAAVTALNEKMEGQSFDSTAKFVIEGEGAVMVDGDGAHAGDEDADVTLTASQETFEAMMSGDLNPTSAFMGGKLAVDGDMGTAMKLGSILA
jgi:putative sterol carrier protein